MIESRVAEVHLCDSNTVSTAISICSTPDTRLYKTDESKLSFLDLPYEIRLRIYHLIHFSSPVLRQQLAPWSCIPTCRTYIVQAIHSTADDADESETSHHDEATAPSRPAKQQQQQQHFPNDKVLSPHRPLCHIPTSFAQTSRQVYAEARIVPWHENEFVFVNWFTPGLSSALAFVQGRQAWQRAEMRFLRLEVFAQDLLNVVSEEESAKKVLADPWVQLCGYLSGIRGLRLMIFVEGGVSYSNQTVNHAEANRSLTGYASEKERGMGYMRKLTCDRHEWISEGLVRLRSLRQLEVELVDVKWTPNKKIEWCARLRALLRAARGGNDVKIICVERVDASVK